jgi:hypothetical protein
MECLKLIGDPAKLHEGRSPSILPGRRASIYPGAVPPAAAAAFLPRAPKVPTFNEGE